MWCCLRRRRESFDDDRTEKFREMPQRRDLSTLPPRRDLAAMPPGRRETVRATTEFKWPPRIGDAALPPKLAQFQHTHTPPPAPISDESAEKEAALGSPTSFHFPPEPVYREQEYHISPQVSSVMLSQEYKRGQEAAALPDLAELPPNELVPQQVHELAGPTPTLTFHHELEGSPDTLRSTRSPTPTSRFSSRR
ncbi:hypothetical protein N0V82_006573 [Gnomoniopsis sp. IMI 355080]|nr:hypothetical protein N0V82_006573 [Gnomoniopsis sp. IMI 355080]